MTKSDAVERRFALGSLRTTASHTIGIPHLAELLRAVPAAAGVEQIDQWLVDVDEDDFVARLGEKLSNKTATYVAGPENN